jgi:hypothetical protein
VVDGNAISGPDSEIEDSRSSSRDHQPWERSLIKFIKVNVVSCRPGLGLNKQVCFSPMYIL